MLACGVLTGSTVHGPRFQAPFRLPLGPKPLAIFAHDPGEIGPDADERPAAEMVDERVTGDHRPEAGLDGPQAIIVVLEAAHAKLLVERPDRIDNLALDQEAEPDQPIDFGTLAFVSPAPIPCEAVQVGQAVVARSTCCGPLTKFEHGPTSPIDGSL